MPAIAPSSFINTLPRQSPGARLRVDAVTRTATGRLRALPFFAGAGPSSKGRENRISEVPRPQHGRDACDAGRRTSDLSRARPPITMELVDPNLREEGAITCLKAAATPLHRLLASWIASHVGASSP
jgi:hypothetical protein